MTALAKLPEKWLANAATCRADAERLGEGNPVHNELLRDAAQYEQCAHALKLALSPASQGERHVEMPESWRFHPSRYDYESLIRRLRECRGDDNTLADMMLIVRDIQRGNLSPPAHGDGEAVFVAKHHGDYWTVQVLCGEEPRTYVIRKADGALFELPDDRVPFVTFPATRPTPEAQGARDAWTTKSPDEPGWYWHDDGDVMVPLFVFKRPGHEYLAVQEDAHPVTGKRSFRMVNRIGGKWSAIHAPLRRRDAALALPAQGEGNNG